MMKPIYLGFDIPGYHARLCKTIRRYGLPRGAPRAWLRDPDFQARDYLGYMQPSSAMYWQCYLYAALQAAGIDQRPDLSTITSLDERWHFGERAWNFAPKKIEYQVRRALKGLNYLVMIEFEVFGNLRYRDEWIQDGEDYVHDRGRLITPHIQGLLWGQRPSRRQRAQFAGGIFDAPGIELKSLTNFAGAVRYMVKPPYMGQMVHHRPGGRVRYPWADMPLLLHHLLFCNLFEYSYSDLTFAGGEGRAILAHANRLWRNYSPVGLRRYAYPQQPFHQMHLRRNSV
jgi:hypothetical protein